MRAVLFAAALAAVAALAGCGTPCGPSNCAGCCDASGACQAPAVDSCGLNGAACMTCVGVQQCIQGTCAFPGGGSGGGGNTGSATAGTSSSGVSSGSSGASTTSSTGGSSGSTGETSGTTGSATTTTSSSGTTGEGTTTTSTSSSGGTTGETTGSSSGTTTGGSTGGTTGTTTGSSGACTEISLDAWAWDSANQIDFTATVLPSLGSASVTDRTELQFYGPDGGAYAGSGEIPLSSGADANYATCVECLLVFQDYDPSVGAAKTFFQQSGALFVNSVSTANGALSGTLDDVTLVEVTIDPNTFTSTPVAGGACLHLSHSSISVP